MLGPLKPIRGLRYPESGKDSRFQKIRSSMLTRSPHLTSHRIIDDPKKSFSNIFFFQSNFAAQFSISEWENLSTVFLSLCSNCCEIHFKVLRSFIALEKKKIFHFLSHQTPSVSFFLPSAVSRSLKDPKKHGDELLRHLDKQERSFHLKINYF